MSLRINFFPLHFIVALLALVATVIVFSDTIYVYMSSSIFLNSFILMLFILCILWQLGVLSYYSRSTRVLNQLLGVINPAMSGDGDNIDTKKQAMYVSSSISGTLIDSPIISKLLSVSIKSGRIELSSDDADIVARHVIDNGDRMLALSKFLTSLFTMLGLLGTFLGLLQTIDGVGKALGSLSNIDNVDIMGFVKLLADPLRGMSVAFSTSLFGLVAALFGNYGNYVAQQKLNLLTTKLRNFLLASSAAVSASSNNRLEAKDILMSLDDSFNRLYEGLVERLDIVADAVISMSKAIVRTQERQEKILKIIIDSLSTSEELLSQLPKISETMIKISMLSEDMKKIALENREELFDYVDSTILKLMKKMTVDLDKTTKISAGILRASSDNVEIGIESVKTSSALNKIAEEANTIAADGVSGIQASVNALADSNLKLDNVRDLVSSEVAILDDGLSVVKSIAARLTVESYMPPLVDIVNLLGSSNALLDGANGSLRDIGGSLVDVKDISGAILEKIPTVADYGDFYNDIFNSVKDLGFLIDSGNKILDVSASSLFNINRSLDDMSARMSEDIGNYLNQLLGVVSEVGQSIDVSNQMFDTNLGMISNLLSGVESLSSASQQQIYIAGEILSNMSNYSPMFSQIIESISTSRDMVASYMDLFSDRIDSNTSIAGDILFKMNDVVASVNDMSYNISASNQAIYTMSESILSAVDSMSNVATVVDVNMNSLSNAFDDFTNRFSYMLDIFQTNVYAISQAQTVGEELINRLMGLSNTIQILNPLISNLIDSADRSTSSVDTILDSLATVVNQIDLGLDTMNGVYDSVSSMVDVITDYSMITTESNNILTNIHNHFTSNLDKDNYVYDGMSQLLESFASLRDMYADELNYLSGSMSNSVDTLTNTFDYISQNLGNAMPLFDQMSNFLNKAEGMTLDTLSNISKDLVSVIGIQSSILDVVSNSLFSIEQSSLSLANKIDNIEFNIYDQMTMVSNINMNLDRLASDKGDFTYNINDKYDNLQDAMYSLVNNFDGMTLTFSVVADELVRQTEVLERNSDLVSSLSDNMASLSESNSYLKDVGDNITNTADQLLYLGDVLTSLYGLANGLESNLKDFAENMSLEVKNLSLTLSQISNADLYNEALQINDSMKAMKDMFEDYTINKSSKNISEDDIQEFFKLLDSINVGISDLKLSIAENASSSVLQNYQGNPVDFTNALQNVIEALNMMNLKSEDSLNVSSSILSLLNDLKLETVDENMKMSIIANAIDSLITELLNSRDVSENILKILSSNKII